MNRYVAILVAALCFVPTYAQGEDIPYPVSGIRMHDDLVPEAPAVAGLRYLLIRDLILMHKFQSVDEFEFRALGIPTESHQAEFAIGFSDHQLAAVQLKSPLAAVVPQSFIGDVFRPPVLAEPDNAVAFAELQPLLRDLGKRVANLEVEQCRVGLDPSLGKRLAAVWKRMLERTRYPDPDDYQSVEFFGSSDEYHFSFNNGGGWGGTTLSGISFFDEAVGTRAGQIVGVARAMHDYCMSKNPKRFTDMLNTLGGLEAGLKELDRNP